MRIATVIVKISKKQDVKKLLALVIDFQLFSDISNRRRNL